MSVSFLIGHNYLGLQGYSQIRDTIHRDCEHILCACASRETTTLVDVCAKKHSENSLAGAEIQSRPIPDTSLRCVCSVMSWLGASGAKHIHSCQQRTTPKSSLSPLCLFLSHRHTPTVFPFASGTHSHNGHSSVSVSVCVYVSVRVCVLVCVPARLEAVPIRNSACNWVSSCQIELSFCLQNQQSD